jgi:hypothetical protein
VTIRRFKLEDLAGHAGELFDQLSKVHNTEIEGRRQTLTKQEGILVSYVAARLFLSHLDAPADHLLTETESRDAVEMVINIMRQKLDAPILGGLA